MTEAKIAGNRLTKSLEDLGMTSESVYPHATRKLRIYRRSSGVAEIAGIFSEENSFSGPNYVPEQHVEESDLGIDVRGAFRVTSGIHH
jgi:hypothetical protein